MHEGIFGIIPPMVTPFCSDGSVDESALRSDARYLVETAGVHGLAVGGSTGEGHTLTTADLRQITEAVVDEVAGRVPVIAGIIVNSTAAAIERGRAVKDLGVAALQVTPVHYLFRPTDDAMLAHFDAVSSEAECPVIIYNVVPWSYLSPELLARIIRSADGVIGVKQSAGDMKLLADLIVDVGDTGRILTAVDALLLPSFMLGAHGAVAAILTAAPTLCVELWNTNAKEEYVSARSLHEKLLSIWNSIADDNLPANVKHCMKLQNRAGGHPRAPMPQSSEAQAVAIQKALTAAELV